jgi:hypothetical protein
VVVSTTKLEAGLLKLLQEDSPLLSLSQAKLEARADPRF